MKNATRLTVLAIALLALAAVPATATEGVSPGAVDRVATIEQRCPTFSWGEDDNAAAYELVAYRLPESGQEAAELSSENEVLFASVAGAATSWTPSADQCFVGGERYVWFVRSVTELIDDQVIEAGEWSAGRYFSVPAGPSAKDVARALEVLKRWEAANGGGVASPSSAGTRSGGASPTLRRYRAGSARADAGSSHRKGEGEGEGGGEDHRKSVTTAAAAIRGEHPDISGEVYGVVGTSASADGAGVAAANLDGGPDLVLDGSASGEVDTLINEDMLKRSSPDDLIFLFHNGGGGVLDLHVHGSLNGDGLNVQYGTVIDDAGNWLGVGDTVPCPGCVESSDIADGSIIDNDLADDAVTEEKIEPGAVGTTKLQNSSVTSAKIADGSVGAADLSDDAVTGAKIADGSVGESSLRSNAVTTGKIADGTIVQEDLALDSVSKNNIQDNAVVSGKILDGTIGSTDLADGAVTSAKIADGAIASADLADSAVTGAKIADGTIASADIGASQINSTHILNMSVDTAELAPDAVTSSKIEDGTLLEADLADGIVTAAKITDGTLTADDVSSSAGIYSSNSLYYTNMVEETIDPGFISRITAMCNDVNDLPISGGCYEFSYSVNGLILMGFRPFNWIDPTNPAEYWCRFENNTDVARFGRAEILCIDVP